MNQESSDEKSHSHDDECAHKKKAMTVAERVAKLREKEKQIKAGTFVRTVLEFTKEKLQDLDDSDITVL